MGLAAGDSLLKDILGLVKATIREACRIQIIAFIGNKEPHLGSGYVYADGNGHSLWLQRSVVAGWLGFGQFRGL